MKRGSPKNKVENSFKNESQNINTDANRDIELRVIKSKQPQNKLDGIRQDTSSSVMRMRSQLSLNQIQLTAAKDNQQRPLLKVSKSCQTQHLPFQQQQQSSQKRKQTTLFILNCLCTLNVALQNILFFFTKQSQGKEYYLVITVALMNVFFLLNSIYTASNLKQFICIALLIDNIFLTQIVASIGFVGLNMIYFTGKWPEYCSIILVPFLHFFLSASFRFSLMNYNWNRLKTIIFKVFILFGAIVLFGIGTYIMFINFKISDGLDPNMDSRFKDFTLLYTFGNFAFFSEMYMKIGDFDKTGDLEFNYHIALETQEQTLQTQNDQQQFIEKIEFHELIQSQQKQNFRQKIKENINPKLIFL